MLSVRWVLLSFGRRICYSERRLLGGRASYGRRAFTAELVLLRGRDFHFSIWQVLRAVLSRCFSVAVLMTWKAAPC